MLINLIKKYDKRTNTERYTISKKQYIRDKIHLSELQDKQHKRLTDKGYGLERSIRGSDRKHIKIKEYKRIKELEPKIKQVFNEVNNYADSYKSLEKENQNIKKEVKSLRNKNEELEKENRNLHSYIKYLFDRIKEFFRNILLKTSSIKCILKATTK